MKRILIWMPWVLLILVIGSFFIWQKKHEPTVTVAPDGVKMQAEKLEPLVEQNRAGGIVSYHEAVKTAAPAVVSIFVESENQNTQIDPILRELFGDNIPQQNQNALGSGVIVREDGYILTNAHVINDAQKIVVAFNDGRRAEAKLVGTDKEVDLAVIKVDLTNLPVIPFKLSGNQVGDVVLAIGNPFGIGQTVTQGIISATERTDLGINTYENFIQTDAAINPGNSGGALIDVAGNLIGVNTAIFSRTGGSLGIGFAIPASTSKQVLDSILKHGRVVRGWLGVYLKRDDSKKDILNNRNMPAIVAGVTENSPAEKAGLQVDDEIVQINDEKINSPNHLMNLIALQQPDTTIKVTVKRQGELHTVDVVVADRQVAEKRLRSENANNQNYIPLPQNSQR